MNVPKVVQHPLHRARNSIEDRAKRAAWTHALALVVNDAEHIEIPLQALRGLKLGRLLYHVNASEVPTIQYGIVLPILIGALMIWQSEAAKRIIDAVPQEWLVGVQLYRALGVIFLILYATGKLPSLFAWPAGIGDIAIGLQAPVVGLAYARAPRKAAGLVAAWNVFGILDLMIAVGTGFMTAPSLLQPFEVQPTSELMTLLPMVLIPVYLVPLSIVLHLASLAKLRREAGASQG
ncbi:MAG: hypothetical protein ABSA62_14000, partial [Methyloceanibacter sp.]